jgi:hypothetical protein
LVGRISTLAIRHLQDPDGWDRPYRDGMRELGELLVAGSCAIIGMGVGTLLSVLIGAPDGWGSSAGIVVGLAGGVWLAFQTFPHRRRPGDLPHRR